MKRRFFITGFLFSLISIQLIFTGCYSVFSGGTGGTVVDAESNSNPKEGIANVDVYAYTDESARDEDFNGWSEGSVFSPKAEYYGHTTTGANGGFTLSRLVWKTFAPTFGRDADVQEIYLLFYHENYGLTKGSTVIVSDSATDTVYQELTKVRKTTLLNLSFIDVSNDAVTGENVYVKVKVPQTTSSNPSAADRVYDATITGTGSIYVSYPRYKSSEDKNNKVESTPTITIQYYQSAEEITWKGCANGDNQTNDYAFLSDDFSITKVIKNNSYDLRLYGKSTKLRVPTFNGQWGTTNGVVLNLTRSADGVTFTEDCGQTTTYAQIMGTTDQEKNGVFSGLGSGYYWKDDSYTGKYAETKMRISGGGSSKDFVVRSDVSTVNVQN